jgi:hypothetical protein
MLKFGEPGLKTLLEEERKAEDLFGDEYTTDKVSHGFNERAAVKLQQQQEGKYPDKANPVSLPMPVSPVQLISTVELDPDFDIFSMEDHLDRVTSGRAYLKFNAHHNHLRPEDLDVSNMLDKASDFYVNNEEPASEQQGIEYYKGLTEALNSASGIDDFEPFRTHVATVPLELEDSKKYASFVEGLVERLEPVNIDIEDFGLSYPCRAPSARSMHDRLRYQDSDDDQQIGLQFGMCYQGDDGPIPFSIGVMNYDDELVIGAARYPEREVREAIDWISSQVSELPLRTTYDHTRL